MPVQRGVLFPVLVGVLLHGRSGERVPAVRTRHHKRRVPGHDCRLCKSLLIAYTLTTT